MAGKSWVDQSLLDWPEDDFRVFVGDLGNETNDDVLAHAFSKYPSFQKAKVIRNKHTQKSMGYGFASFKDPWDMTKALREMQGKYIGNRPVKVRRSTLTPTPTPSPTLTPTPNLDPSPSYPSPSPHTSSRCARARGRSGRRTART